MRLRGRRLWHFLCRRHSRTYSSRFGDMKIGVCSCGWKKTG